MSEIIHYEWFPGRPAACGDDLDSKTKSSYKWREVTCPKCKETKAFIWERCHAHG